MLFFQNSEASFSAKSLNFPVVQQQIQQQFSEKLSFEENKGQVQGTDKARVRFVIKGNGLDVFILEDGIAYQYKKVHYPEGYHELVQNRKSVYEKSEELSGQIITETFRMDALLVGFNPNAEIIKEGKSADYIQYYNHDALNVHSYQKITYRNIYPKIDWVLFFKDEKLEYEFVVHPGGNPDDIKIRYEHAESVNLLADGSIKLKSRMGDIIDKAPVSFQGENIISTGYHLENNIIQFRLTNYDQSKTLVIDPVVEWATYYGGSSDDVGHSSSVDRSGNVLYMAGRTFSTNAISSGGYQNSLNGTDYDAFLVKFDSAGVRLWATYYGGNHNEVGSLCAVDGSGNVYLGGTTSSSSGISFNGHQNNLGGHEDAFLVKFNSSGIRQWATYYGGDEIDLGNSCAIDNSGNVFLAGSSWSSSGIAFNGHQNTYGGSMDAFLVKFNSNGLRQWATFYGNNEFEEGQSCTVDGSGNVYLSGRTSSASGIALGGHQNTLEGSDDAFLVKFNSSGIRQWATYYGGSNSESGTSCTADDMGNIWLAGVTYSLNNISFKGHQNTLSGEDDAFLVKFNSSGIRQWATYYGGSEADRALSCGTDGLGNIYLAGTTTSKSGIAYDGHQNAHAGGVQDAFLAKFNTNGTRQWATYYGGSGLDIGFSCIANVKGSVFLAGNTGSVNNIASEGHQNIFGGSSDAFLVKFSECLESYTTVKTEICKGELHTLQDGTVISTSGSYPVILKNAAGCDSIVTTELTVNEIYDIQLTATTCNPAEAGVFVRNLKTSSGCDSIVTTTVTFFPAYDIQLTSTTCNPAEAGVFVQNLVTSSGCDSIVTTTVTLLKTYQNAIRDTICVGENYLFGNQKISKSGTYTETYLSQGGCDSTITLHLTVTDFPYWEFASEVVICKEPIAISIPVINTDILWNDGSTENEYTIEKAGSYSVTLSNSCGEYSTTINVIKRCDDCTFALPQAFSPDNNKKNDTFKPITTCEIEHFHIRIYNRWGHLIFESEDLRHGWDGKYKGIEQMMDSYIWQAEYQFKDQSDFKRMSGAVLLLR